MKVWKELQSRWARQLVAGCGLMLAASVAHADLTVLAEEPINLLGRITSSGHAAVYLDRICADSYTHLRHCESGEHGVVLSRYVGFGGYDWVAVDVLSYLYAVETPEGIPSRVTKGQVAELRARYRDTHAAKLPAGVIAGEEQWRELVGSAYRRRTIAVRLHTTPEEEERLLVWLNASGNRSHFNLFWHNCADFAGSLVSVALAEPVHRSYVADAGMMTPKQVVHRMQELNAADSSLSLEAYVVPQVPSSIRRSGRMYGVTEAFVKSKPYLLPLAIVQPIGIGSVVAAWMCDRRHWPAVSSAAEPAELLGMPLSARPVAPAGGQ